MTNFFNKSMLIRIVAFILLNFTALALGSLFTNPGVSSDWYLELNKAPWTPPGWVFGFAWTTIMICFAVYCAILWDRIENKSKFIWMFVVQWILNVGWNPVFFYFHKVGMGLVVISGLTTIIAIFLFAYWRDLKGKSALIIPYFIWLLIATSLNAYILFNN